jgi:hypothetical protein
MASKSLRTGLQLLLWLMIIGLSYVLYYSITEPYKVVEERERVTALTRQRMDMVRQVAIQYESKYDRFPLTLDTLAMYAASDSAFQTMREQLLKGLVLDSLLRSPRTGKMWNYTANDTSRVKTYLLQDPDSDDRIGTLEADMTLLNAASWE